MTHLLVDTSVLIKWFHSEGEGALDQARHLRSAHVNAKIDAHMIDLAVYEVGNVLSRSLRWSAADVADQLDDLHAIMGPTLTLSKSGRRRAAVLAETHALTYYDASWAAAAEELGVALVSAERQLLTAGLAESPISACNRLRLV